ncbi:MAG: DMT family transporter [Pseudomonadota bacterium]
MRLFLFVALTMVAFAANSVLTRMALAWGEIDPGLFAAIRIASGAALLLVLAGQDGGVRRVMAHRSGQGAGALLVYALAFTFAYLSLDAGLGALILFGAVQLTMFAGAVLAGQVPGWPRWVGSALGLAGLVVMFAPGAAAPPLAGAALMALAGIAWGLYSLRGAGAADPLRATAANFVLATPVAVATGLLLSAGGTITPTGVLLAVASGALASGLGYSLWYAVLPRLEASLAAVAQLTVPIIALTGGAAILGEPLTLRFAIASVLVIGGVLLATFGPNRQTQRNRAPTRTKS